VSTACPFVGAGLPQSVEYVTIQVTIELA